MIIDDIALTLHPEIGCKTAIHLIECFGSAAELFKASEEEIVARTGLKTQLAKSISRREYHSVAEKEIAFLERNKITALSVESSRYPQALRECPDYPHVLYTCGDYDLNRGRFLSVVGTRQITRHSEVLCEKLIQELAERVPDLVIVSGLAYGVDIAAHRAALRNNVPTIAVMGIPLTSIYPKEHTESARRIVHQGGAVLSEFPSTAKPDKSGFVQRNRIIAGLSEGTLIVESAAKGGSLITADMADGYHRTVMAVPGRPGDKYSEGTNALLRSLKAQMVCSATDVLDVLGWNPAPRTVRRAAKQTTLFDKNDSAVTDVSGVQSEAQEKVALILDLLDRETPVSIDELSLKSGVSIAQISGILLELEFSDLIKSLPGKSYIKIC